MIETQMEAHLAGEILGKTCPKDSGRPDQVKLPSALLTGLATQMYTLRSPHLYLVLIQAPGA